jgi:hypothetical protein
MQQGGLQMKPLTRQDIHELFYVTPQENMPSILRWGLLAHNEVKRRRIAHNVWHMEAVQRRRDVIVVPVSKRRLHDYVNLYFNCRNAALYARKDQFETLCILGIDSSICDLPGVIVAPQNAASHDAVFLPFQTGITHIFAEHVFASSWVGEDSQSDNLIRSRMMAELLVPHTVTPEFIKKIYVCSAQARDSLLNYTSDTMIQIRPELFFIGPFNPLPPQ